MSHRTYSISLVIFIFLYISVSNSESYLKSINNENAVVHPMPPKGKNYETHEGKNAEFRTKDCYEHNVDYTGDDINNGLLLLTATASQCQANCAVNADCNYFTWVDPNGFPDENYYNSCWMKRSITSKNGQVGVVSGPKICDENGCCNTLNFKSSGSLAEGGQKHVLGFYDYSEDGVDGTKIYHQPGNGGSQPELWLYLLKGGFNTWFISEIKGYNGGYAWNADGDSECPEQLEHIWQWYDMNTGDMVVDPTARMDCEEPPPPEDCCDNLIFESTGSIADGGQAHILGSYDFSGDGQEDTKVYKQVGGSNYMYYMYSLELWYIGDTPGVNLAYAMNQDTGSKCPEYLANAWQWWNWKEDEWTLDETANIKCR